MRCIVFSLTLLAAAPAAAQDAPPAGYRAVIDEAIAESGASRWEEARALFRRAHGMYPNARTLRGIGMSSFELRDYVGAYRALGEALASTVQPLTAEQQGQVR